MGPTSKAGGGRPKFGRSEPLRARTWTPRSLQPARFDAVGPKFGIERRRRPRLSRPNPSQAESGSGREFWAAPTPMFRLRTRLSDPPDRPSTEHFPGAGSPELPDTICSLRACCPCFVFWDHWSSGLAHAQACHRPSDATTLIHGAWRLDRPPDPQKKSRDGAAG